MDEESGLDDLVAQRKSRSAFVRMISWEIDNSGSVANKKQRNISAVSAEDESSLEDGEDEVNSEDSEDSEYYSAGEEVQSLSDDCDTPSNYTATDQLSEMTEESCSTSVTTEESCSTSVTTEEIDGAFDSLNGSSPLSDVRRGLSKKQKKRRREKMRRMSVMTYADYDVPFRNVEDIDIEVSDLVGFTDELTRSCTRNVPTLFELCLCVVSVRRPNKPRQSTSEIPRLVKHVLSDRRRDQSFTSVQLSWLYRLMGYAEENLFERFVKKDSEKSDPGKVELSSRNIWNSFCLQSDHNDAEYIGSRVASILLYSYLQFDESLSHDSIGWRYPFTLMSILASAADLMLPQQLSTGRLRHASRDSSTESEIIQKTTDAIVYSVKHILKKRYPGVVEHFFDEAVPYVFWARGNLKFAAELFVRLAQAKEGKDRARLLCEAARLYAQNEESDKASRLYREASGAVISKAIALKQDHDVTLQQFMLMASVYDQGVMTSEKTSMAARAWAAAMKYFDPKCPWSSATRAVESFLCFHSGSSQESSKERLEAACKLMEGLCKDCDLILLYMSLVKALLGDRLPCFQAYRAFISSATASLFELASGEGARRSTPWQPLIDHFQNHGTPNLLKVVWRTQLGHLRVVNNLKAYDSDLTARNDLHLHLTETGYLTADLQMMLPPIRALQLDPYTGLHVHTSGQTQAWHSLSYMDLYHAENASGFFLVPTLVELYCDENGNRIHILTPDNSLITRENEMSKQMTLFWTGSNGQKARLNLIPLLKDVIKQHTFDLINIEVKKNPNAKPTTRGSEDWVEKMRLCTDFGHKKGYAMGIYNMESLMSSMWKEVLKSTNKDKRGQMTKKEWNKKKEKKQHKSPSVKIATFAVQLEEYYQYGDTLYLGVYHNARGHNKRIHVFIGGTSKEDFLEPEITMVNTHASLGNKDEPDVSSIQTPKMSSKYPHIRKDKIMWRLGSSNNHSLDTEKLFKVYGRKGEVLKTISDVQSMEAPFVLGRKLYGMSENKMRVCCIDLSLTGDQIVSEELTHIRKLQFGGGKVIAVCGSAIYFLDPDNLSVLKIALHKDSTVTELNDDGRSIKCPEGARVDVLEQKTVNVGDVEKIRVAVGVNTTLLFMDVKGSDVEIVLDVKVPGIPREVCTVSPQVGFLVTATIHLGTESFHRENLLYYRYDGMLQGVLPFLGPGPRGFCVEYFRGSGDFTGSGEGQKGYYVFMRDGHEGIISVKLS